MARSKRHEHHGHKGKKHHHDKGDGHKHHKHDHDPGDKPPPGSGAPGAAGDQLKELSVQSSQDAMDATPGSYPADPANMQAVYSTGPGEAVEYNYVRVNGENEQYALQQSQYSAPVPPISGFGQVLTSSSAGGTEATRSGAANNPT